MPLLGFRIYLGFRVYGLGFRVYGLGFRDYGLGFRHNQVNAIASLN